ncbi:MAG: hypothetical protein FWH18_10245 [Marinilabiliaceae bacterium]|nr:hypothetical protein [Marinilabiliaceae bacterium]
MQRKEINIFSISFLDLLSGALGAVLILFIIIPKMHSEYDAEYDYEYDAEYDYEYNEIFDYDYKYYPEYNYKYDDRIYKPLDGAISELIAQLCIVCHWKEYSDVDLYVQNLSTTEICFHRNMNTTFGKLYLDFTPNEANDAVKYELFYQKKIVPGEYMIYTGLFSGANLKYPAITNVTGYVIMFPGTKNEKKIEFRPIRLSLPGEMVIIGTLIVTENNIILEQ